MQSNFTISSKKRPINLTIREDVVRAAKALNLNASQAAEAGIQAAIREARTQEWLRSNKSAIFAHNNRIDQSEVLLRPTWSGDDRGTV